MNEWDLNILVTLEARDHLTQEEVVAALREVLEDGNERKARDEGIRFLTLVEIRSEKEEPTNDGSEGEA